MTHSFIAYIDESGDEGLTGKLRSPGIAGGSSHWLAIGATVWRQSRDLDAVKWANSIIQNLPQQRRKKPLHFMDLNHAQRVMAVQTLCNKPFRAVTVMAHKQSLQDGTFSNGSQLYQYICRYLIERISWLCRDLRPDVPEGDGRVKIVFSRKRSMSYDDFRDYLNLLKSSNSSDIRIHWPVIDVDGIEAQDHGSRFGLQLADIVVSGITAALEPDYYGNVEARYARMLKPQMYSRQKNFLSYGTKFIPPADQIELNDQQKEFLEIFG